MKDARLTKNSSGDYDLMFENGVLGQPVEDGAEVAQHCVIRLLKFKGESVIDDATEDGTKWYEIIFDASKSKAHKLLELKRRILGTAGVKKILSLDWMQSGSTVTIEAAVQTEWGDETISDILEPL
jgi:hypothetical protein